MALAALTTWDETFPDRSKETRGSVEGTYGGWPTHVRESFLRLLRQAPPSVEGRLRPRTKAQHCHRIRVLLLTGSAET